MNIMMLPHIQEMIDRIKAEKWNPADPVSKMYYKAPGTHLGFHFAKIVDNKDPEALGRVKVHLSYMGDNFVTGWVPVARPFAGDQTGSWFLPEVDTPVLCAFIGDRPDRPVVLGTIYTAKVKPPVTGYGNSNLKVLKTKGGTEVIFDDTDGTERLTICTKDGKMRLSMDGEDGIYLVNEEGDIEITCEKFVVKSEDAALMEFTKDLKVTCESGDIQVDAKKQMCLKAQSEAELKGTKIKLNGSTGVTAANKQVAAKDDYVVGVDFHQIEVPTPGGLTPVPMIPHPYLGKLADKLSEDVTVNDRDAAVKGSKSKFDTPGHIPMPPGVKFSSNPSNEGEVTSNTVPTVKINGKETAVIGSMVNTCNDPSDQETCSVVAIGMSVALPIMLPGMDPDQYERDGGTIFNLREPVATLPLAIDPAQPPLITSVKWNASKAKVGEKVTLSANLSNQYEGANVYFTIWEEGADLKKDAPVKKLSGRHEGGKAGASWIYHYIHDPDDPLLEKPKFIFTAKSYGCDPVESGPIEIGSDLKAVCRDTTGDLLADLPYWLMKNGQKDTEGKTGSDGILDEKDVVPGQAVLFDFKDYKKGEANKKESSEVLPEEDRIKQQNLKGEDFSGGFFTEPGIVSEIIIPTLVLRLNINPDERESQDDKYKLYSNTTGNEYECTQTSADDKVVGDDFLDLHFVGLNPKALYSLEIDMGKEGIKYNLFSRCALEDLFRP